MPPGRAAVPSDLLPAAGAPWHARAVTMSVASFPDNGPGPPAQSELPGPPPPGPPPVHPAVLDPAVLDPAVLDPAVLHWAAGVAGCPGVTVLRGLRDGGSPWLVRAGERELVLRTGRPGEERLFAAEVAGLRLAAQAGVPVPALLGHDAGPVAGVPVLLTTCLPGTSTIPPDPRPARLRALGAVAARLHAVPRQPSPDLPRRHYPIGDTDFAALRAGHDMGQLQRIAEARLARLAPTDQRLVFVHGDLWQGNALWAGDTLSGLVDWDCAGAGAPGVDLGSLRMDAAFCYGQGAAAEVLAGYEQAAGAPAADVAYWDVVAALATPPGLGWFPDAIARQGRPDLTRELLLRRHDGFLRSAVERLP